VDIPLVDSARMAEAAGIKLTSFRVALARSKKRREAGTALSTDIPEPDRFIGRSPVWGTAKRDQWVAARTAAGVRDTE